MNEQVVNSDRACPEHGMLPCPALCPCPVLVSASRQLTFYRFVRLTVSHRVPIFHPVFEFHAASPAKLPRH